jgi:hypothetical protein
MPVAQNLNSLDEIAAALKTVAVAGDELGNAAVPVKLASFSIAKGPTLTLGPSQLSFSAGLSADVEEFNSEDDSDDDGILLAGGKPPIALSKESAWLKYRLGGTLRLQGGAEIGSVGFTLDAEGGLDLFDYRFHDRTEKVAAAAAADLGSPRFIFDFSHVLALKPREALALRSSGSLTLGISIAWSDVLTAGLKSVTSLLRATTPVNITISTGLQAALDVTLGGEFLLVFSVGDDKTLRLSLRKASTRGVTGTVTAGLSAKMGNLDKALLAVLDSLVAGDFQKILGTVQGANPAAPAPSELQLFDALVERFGLQDVVQKMPDLAKWLESLQSSVRDAIKKAAETRIELGFKYEYSRSEKNELLLDVALLEPATFQSLHADLVKGKVAPLLQDLTANATRYRLNKFLRRDTLTTGGSWGFSLSAGKLQVLKGVDTETLTKVTESDWKKHRRITYDGLRGYSASIFGEQYSWTTDFTARMAAFKDDPRAADFDYGLHLSFQPSSRISPEDADHLIDLANLWRADGQDAISTADLTATLKRAPTRFSVELTVPEAALAEVAQRAVSSSGPDLLPEALAGALPFRDFSPARQRLGLRTALYAPLWRAILENPDFRFRGESQMRLWVQNSLRATDMALSIREAQPQLSGTLVHVLEKQSFFFNPPNSFLGHVTSFRTGIASLAHVLGSQAGSVSPDEIPFAYQQLLPFLSQSFFLNTFARYIVLLAADAGATGQITSSARLDYNGGADTLLF